MIAGEPSLIDEARAFAKTVSDSVSAFLGVPTPFEAQILDEGDRVWVTDQGAAGITLSVEGKALLSLDVSFYCTWDGAGRYLAVHSSRISVHAGPRPKGDPLFRYEYERSSPKELPAAHVHVHAHRDQFSHVMALSGLGGARRRAQSMADVLLVPRLAELHFPVGGHRFRPCLEDVLAVLHTEFGVDTGNGWQEVLDAARAEWRRQQLGAAVRDCPAEAARVLRELGWDVTAGEGAVRKERLDRLAAL